jgi:hypothetical protein
MNILAISSPSADPVNHYDVAFKGFPKQEMFRLYIDRKFQDLGKKAFDQDRITFKGNKVSGEPGYQNAMSNGFRFVKETIGQKFDVDFLIQLHDICVDKVSSYQEGFSGYSIYHMVLPIKKGLHRNRNYYFEQARMTPLAKKECEMEKLICIKKSISSEEYLSSMKKNRIDSHTKDADLTKNTLNQLIECYHREIDESMDSPNEKLRAIVKLCRAIEIYHVFFDGNQRTIAFALMNKLLIENGFSPYIPEEPDMFDGYYGIDELVDRVINGMDTFESYKHNNV